MNDYTKHNAKIAQEFWRKVEEGAIPFALWDTCIEIDSKSPRDHPLKELAFFTAHHKIEWKPKTIKINGLEVPAPMTEEPEDGRECYHHSPYLEPDVSFIWGLSIQCRNLFALGIFDNKEDCEKFAKAYYRPWQELAE